MLVFMSPHLPPAYLTDTVHSLLAIVLYSVLAAFVDIFREAG